MNPKVRFGRKSNEIQDQFYGYKTPLTMEFESEIVPTLAVTAGHVHDGEVFQTLLSTPFPDRQGVDKADDTQWNQELRAIIENMKTAVIA